jgi:type 1 glutamine amidotransferase
MRTGVLCNDRWHPAEVVRQGLEPLSDSDTPLEFLLDTQGWTLERMREYEVLVLSKGNGRAEGETHDWLTDEVQQNFQAFVERGGGLLVCHSGTVGYSDSPLFRGLVGGAFTRHPHQCPVTLEYAGDFGLAEDDPRTIEIFDEHYFVDVIEGIQVFLHSTSEHGTQPAGWTRLQGKGRVCVLTPGHYLEVWQHPVYQHTLRNALDWCAVKNDATTV